MLKIDQSYTLGKAIEAFARPGDRKNREAATRDYLNLVKYVPAPGPSELEIAEWRKENPHGLEALWRSRQQEQFDENRRKQAEDAAARLEELQGQQYARGLKDALYSGTAIAHGRMGGLASPKTSLEPSIWSGNWQLDTRAGFASGGIPHNIEIYDLTIWPGGAALRAASKRHGGAPAKYDWPAIEQEAYRLMDHNGDFSPDDGDWNVQACLVEALQLFYTNDFRSEPSVSSIKGRLPEWLTNWRLKKSAARN